MIEKQKFIATPMGNMPFDWKKHTLSELSEFITKGATPTTYGFKWQDSGITFLRSECVSELGYSESGVAFISKEAHDAMERSKIEGGDILISITGNVGRIAVYPLDKTEGNINQHIARVRIIKKEIANREFIYYQLNQRNYRNYYLGIITGAAYPQLSLKQIRETSVYLPPLKTQKRIADILSAYDDLIENNLKRIKLLEQAALNIYKEWFVNLRFPGHENTAINEETGLPVGWEEKEISTIITFLGGYAFKSKTYIENGKYRVITIKNVGDKVFNASVGNSVDTIPEKMKEHCKIIEGDILLSLTGNVGRTCIAYGGNNLLNQRVAKIEPVNPKWLPYIYWMFNDNKMFSLMNNLATGAAQQNLSPVKLAKEKVVIPSESIIKLYCSKAKSIFKQIILLNKQNQKLKAARDILLPRLMNRTIKV